MLPVFARTFIRSKTTLVTAMQREAFSPGGTEAISPYGANLRPEDSPGDSSSASKQVDLTLYIKPSADPVTFRSASPLLCISRLSLQRLSEEEVNGTAAGFILFYFIFSSQA